MVEKNMENRSPGRDRDIIIIIENAEIFEWNGTHMLE